MRTKSIVSIIRRYGLSSKRLNPRNRIKYEDAIKGLKGYESSELKIAEVIDNTLYPRKSISCKCQIPGCNHKIRYEYVLENKISKDRIVAGSTCVWPTLGLSELEKKGFQKFEKAVKEFHDMIIWKDENKDVWDKLEKLKNADMTAYRPFWKEVEFCRLTDEDTAYIRSLDVDELIRKRDEKVARQEELRRMTAEQRAKEDAEYRKVVEGLNTLTSKYPDNGFYRSLETTVRAGYRLSPSQVRWVKAGCNKLWYEENIKGTPKDIMDICEDIVAPLLQAYGYSGKNDKDAVLKINDAVKSENCTTKLAWTLFKVRESLVF